MAEQAKVPSIRFAGFTDPWEQRKLGEVAHFINGRAYSQNELLFSGKYPVLRVGNFYTNDSWYYSDLELEDKNYAYEGDLLYTWSATFGPHIWHGNKVIYHYHIWKVQLEAALEKLFAFQLLERDKERILSDKNGSTMVHITKTGIENTSVLMPCSVEEQRRIGAFFDHLDSIITLHQRKYDKLVIFKKSMLEKMFPKDGESVPEIRFAGFTDPWEQRKLGEFGSVAMCKRIYKEQTSEQGDVPFFKIGTFGADPDAFISNELFEDYKRTYPYPTPGTLLISAAGSIGRIVEYQGEKAYFQDSNIVWLEHDHRLNDAFLKPLYSKIEWGLEGSTIKRLYNKDLLSAEVTIPDGREQKEIGQFFAKLDSLITLHQRKLELLRNIKKSLLDKMFV